MLFEASEGRAWSAERRRRPAVAGHGPPHAKFHDAWTISLGALLGGAALHLLLREDRTEQEAILGAALPALFWVGQGAAFAFPGTAGLEAELPQYVPRIKGVWINERFAAGAMLALSLTGYLLDRHQTSGAPTGTQGTA